MNPARKIKPNQLYFSDLHDNASFVHYLTKFAVQRYTSPDDSITPERDHIVMDKLLDEYDLFFLGDICDSGIDEARECIKKLDKLGAKCVLGVHDLAIIDDNQLRKYQVASTRVGESGDEIRKNQANVRNALNFRKYLGGPAIDFLRYWQDSDIFYEMPSGYHLAVTHSCLVPITGKESLAIGLDGKSKTRIIRPEHAKKNLRVLHDPTMLVHGHNHVPYAWLGMNKEDLKLLTKRDPKFHVDTQRSYIACPGSMDNTSGYDAKDFFPQSYFTHIDQYAEVDGKKSNSFATFNSDSGIFEVHFFIHDRQKGKHDNDAYPHCCT